MPAMTHRGQQEGRWLPSRTGYLAGFLQLQGSVLPETETRWTKTRVQDICQHGLPI